MIKLTQILLKKTLRYNCRTGLWYWRISPNGFTPKNSVAGTISSNGYVVIRVFKKAYKAHRLAWFYVTGKWPQFQVDHKDTARANNKWNNLREATRSQNIANSRLRKDNIIGLKGAYSKDGKWQSAIRHNNKLRHLGTFRTPKAANVAYMNAAIKFHGNFARSR